MAIDLLTACEWVSAKSAETIIEGPSWSDVERAVKSLDGRSRNDLYLTPNQRNPDTYLCVGGGAGRYIVTGAIEGREFPTVADPGRPPEPEERVVVGGQEGLYPGNWVVDLEVALRAARVFYDLNEFGGGLNWIQA